MVGKRTTKRKERLSSTVHGNSEEVKEDEREVKVTVKIDSSEGKTKRDYPKSKPESIRLPPRVDNMEKENAIASGKNDRSDNDCLHSGLFPESPECQRNIQVMKPGDGSYLESSNATIVSNTRQESVEHNIFHLSHKHFPVNNCTETVNIEIVSDGKPERLASTVQDYSENHSGIKSPIIIHPNENPLNHMNPEYVHLKNIYHQDPSYSVLSPLSTNMAIIPGNEHSGNVKKCTSSLSPVSSAPDVASDILVLESKDARSDDVEKGKPHVPLPYRMHEDPNISLREYEDGALEDSLINNFTNCGLCQYCQSTEKLELNERVINLPELDEPLQESSYLSTEAVIAFRHNMPYLQGLEEASYHPLLSRLTDRELHFDLCSSFHVWNAFRVFIAGFVMYLLIN